MFKNAVIYRIREDWIAPPGAAIEEALGLARFTECGPTQRESHGWVEPRGEKHGALAEFVGGQLILKMGSERRLLPAGVVREELDKRMEKMKAETGRAPRGKQKAGLKESLELELLPKCFTKKGATTMWVNVADKFIVVNSGSPKSADRIVDAFMDVMAEIGHPVTLGMLETKMSPATAMAFWLNEQVPPSGFSVDRECELKQPDSEKACVRYSRHNLDIDEIREHIKQGKLPTKLALTWGSRVSFVLNDNLVLGKIKLLDVVLEGANKADTGFDADVAIMTGELSKVIPDIINALDGELDIFAKREDAGPTEENGKSGSTSAVASEAVNASYGADDASDLIGGAVDQASNDEVVQSAAAAA